MSLDLEALETSLDVVPPHGGELIDAFCRQHVGEEPARHGAELAAEQTMVLRLLRLVRLWLRDLDAIVPLMHDLGARYGAGPEHYPIVGGVLIASMAEAAGDAWEPRYERAWVAAFDVVADAMLDAASRRLEVATGRYGTAT